MTNQDSIQPETECVVCGSYIHTGSYPPLCSDFCKQEFKIESEFNKWAKAQRSL